MKQTRCGLNDITPSHLRGGKQKRSFLTQGTKWTGKVKEPIYNWTRMNNQ